MKRCCQAVVVCAGLVLMAGCSGGASDFDEELISVTGSVKINGEPASGVALAFHPEDGTSGTGGYAVTDENGSFVVMHRSQKEGIEKGKYKVTFSKFTMEDGSPIPEGKDLADVGGGVQVIPASYNSIERTGEVADISENPGTLDYDLKIKK